MLHGFVVALVGVFDAVPHRRLDTLFCCQLALLIHVGAADQLDSQIEVVGVGSAHFHWDDLAHALEVALVAVHDGDVVSTVQLLSHLLAKGLNASLDEGLLGVHIEEALPFAGHLAKYLRSLSELVEVLEVSLGHSAQDGSQLLNKWRSLGVGINFE